MGRWFVEFLSSQGFSVEVADRARYPRQLPRSMTAQTDVKPTTSCWHAPGVTDAILRELALRRPAGVIFDVGSLKSRCVRSTRIEVARLPGDFRASDVRARHGVAVRGGTSCLSISAARGSRRRARVVCPDDAEAVVMSLDDHDRLIAYVLGLSIR